ncbi:MAG: 1-acyl-sn-glycerol-3-phosphate acyltransferase [Bacteroidales bacterium]|nr:1-acyl-sn-glycerol-3-phosphate acyltransferase [Bacteroidales bacterium]
MAKKIQDPDFWYSFFLPYVNWHTRTSYRRFEVHGKENVPKDSAVIFGVNHSNTLMDALVLLSSNNVKKVFIARGDIFKNPVIAKILHFLRILPIFRIRNGVAAVRQNDDSLNKAVDVIHDNVDLYLFPEGMHRTKHSLLRLSKGLFHIAVDANKQFGDQKPVYIVPTAIEYGDYFRYRSTAMIQFGQAINVTEFLKSTTEENEAANINILKERLHDEISKLFTYIPDDEDYDAIWEIVKMKNEKRAGGLYKKMLRNRSTVANVLKYREEQPEEAKDLFQKVLDFATERKRQKISVMSTAKRKPLVNSLWKLAVLLVGLPYFAASAIVNLPTWVTTLIIRSKLKDPAFGNTVSFGVRFVLSPLIFIVGTIILFCNLHWPWALLGTVILFFSYRVFVDYCELSRRWISDVRWTFKNQLRKQYEALNINKLF